MPIHDYEWRGATRVPIACGYDWLAQLLVRTRVLIFENMAPLPDLGKMLEVLQEDGNHLPDQDHSHVHDIRLRETGLNEPAQRLKEMVSVMASQEIGRGHSQLI